MTMHDDAETGEWLAALRAVELQRGRERADVLVNRFVDQARRAKSGVDAWLDHCAALAGGVLIGLSEGLEPITAAAAKQPAARARKA